MWLRIALFKGNILPLIKIEDKKIMFYERETTGTYNFIATTGKEITLGKGYSEFIEKEKILMVIEKTENHDYEEGWYLNNEALYYLFGRNGDKISYVTKYGSGEGEIKGITKKPIKIKKHKIKEVPND